MLLGYNKAQGLGTISMGFADRSETFAPMAIANEKKRAIAYSMDTLIPGFYLWLGSFSIRLFGEVNAADTEPLLGMRMLNDLQLDTIEGGLVTIEALK